MTSNSKAVELPSSEVKTMDLFFPEHQLSGERTQYLCSSFALPENLLGKTIYLKKIELIDNVEQPSVLHHLVVFSSIRDHGVCPFDCIGMPDGITGVSWAWALGQANLELSSNQYMSLHDNVVLQIHYDNYISKKIIDRGSGVRVHYTELEPTDETHVRVGTVATGSSLAGGDWEIPPNTKNTTLMFENTIRLVNDVTIRSWLLHIHQLGTRGRLELYRDGKFVSFLGCMGYRDVYGVDEEGISACHPWDYDFNLQTEIILDSDVILKNGDVLRLICEMDSTGRETVTKNGEGSDEEMCQTIFTVYPAENILQSSINPEATLMVIDGNITIDRMRSL